MGDKASEVKVDLWKIINLLLGVVLGIFSYVLNWVVTDITDHSAKLVAIQSTMLTSADRLEIEQKIHSLEREVLTDGRFNRR